MRAAERGREVSEEITGVIVCRQASDPLKPEAQLGYECKICGKALAVSPEGVAQIARGGVPLCNPCGMAMIELQVGMDCTGPVVINPSAMRTVQEQGLEGELRDALHHDSPPPPAERVDCPLCGREYSTISEGQVINCPCGISFELARA
jgi:DNA-directed RNA polymerase subunit RPC12/RpoP